MTGFDYGDTPSELVGAPLEGKRVALRADQGIQAMALAQQADMLLVGCFLNLQATVDYILSLEPERVTLNPIGREQDDPSPEDDLCAMMFHRRLLGKPSRFEEMKEQIRNSEAAQRSRESGRSWYDGADFELCMDLNKFDFVLRADPKRLTLERVTAAS